MTLQKGFLWVSWDSRLRLIKTHHCSAPSEDIPMWVKYSTTRQKQYSSIVQLNYFYTKGNGSSLFIIDQVILVWMINQKKYINFFNFFHRRISEKFLILSAKDIFLPYGFMQTLINHISISRHYQGNSTVNHFNCGYLRNKDRIFNNLQTRFQDRIGVS